MVTLETLLGPLGDLLVFCSSVCTTGALGPEEPSGRLLPDGGTSVPDIHALGSKCDITGLVAEVLPIMATGDQCLVAELTLETDLVLVLAQGAHLLSEVHSLVTLGMLGGHGLCAQSVCAFSLRSSF